MGSAKMSGFKRFLLWDYPRASWQYDLMVGLILAFIFLTPRDFFRDQPRASNLVQVPAEHGANVFFVETELLESLPDPERGPKVEQMLKSRYGKRESVIRLEPIHGNEQEIKGFLAYTRP
jgi:hypothetical protein